MTWLSFIAPYLNFCMTSDGLPMTIRCLVNQENYVSDTMDHVADRKGKKHYVDWKREDKQLMTSELGFQISNNQK